jgi:hypothetical protein
MIDVPMQQEVSNTHWKRKTIACVRKIDEDHTTNSRPALTALKTTKVSTDITNNVIAQNIGNQWF